MKINLNTLNKPLEINEIISIPPEIYKNSSIKKLENIAVKGYIKYNLTDEIEINLDVHGIMVLLDSVTLDEINHPFSFTIEEILSEDDENSHEYLAKDKNILDIIEILWENIVLEVPISLTNNPNKELKGEGWSLNGEESKDEIDPRLQKLNDLFKGGE